MRHLSKTIRISALLILLLIGVWAMTGSVGPGAESVAHTRAMAAPGATSAGAVSAEAVTASQRPKTLTTAKRVDMMNLPDIAASDGQYERYMRGEIDMEMESKLGRPEVQALQAAAMNLTASPNIFNPRSSDVLVPSLLTNFDGPSIDDYGGPSASVPPDSDLGAGPNHLIAIVNVAFMIYDKSGSVLVGSTPTDTFFGANPACTDTFDPVVMYDDEVDRWVMGVDSDGDEFCVAYSDTADPTGIWWVYAYPADNGGAEFFDYPHIGMGDHAMFVGSNQFTDPGFGWAGGQIMACDKNAGYAGLASACRTYNLLGMGDPGTPQPLNLTGWSQGTVPKYVSKHHAFVAEPYDGKTLELWKWSDALGSGAPAKIKSYNQDTLTGVVSGYPVTWFQKPDVGHPTPDTITANDWRQRGFEFRNGTGWTTDTVSCNPGAGTVNCVRWAQISLFPPFPYLQGGVIASNKVSRVFPDITANHCNDMALVYSGGYNKVFPTIGYTGRQSGDPLGTVQGEKILKWGEESYFTTWVPTPTRWGDYSGMAIDPNGKTFWFMGEYAKSGTSNAYTNWGNYIGSFEFSCVVP